MSASLFHISFTSRLLGALVCVFFLLCACACAEVHGSPPHDPQQALAPAEQRRPFAVTPGKEVFLPFSVAQCWSPLLRRLKADNMDDPAYEAFFAGLGPYSPDPMAAKVKELFTRDFLRPPPPPRDPDAPPAPAVSQKARIYKGVVTQATMERCRNFLAENKPYFDVVEKKYPVPRQIIVALLFVETRLGTFLGKESAFWSLACMAAADSPQQVNQGLGGLLITAQHNDWLQARLTDKSNWAYKELKALLKHCSVNRLDPHVMPGSVYGAIGMCQFMPSNLVPYGEDGDGDGRIDLFTAPDAIFSAAKYLSAHGWKKGLTVDQQRGVLRKYNNLTIYANTILTLAESVRTGAVQTAPPDIPRKAAPKAKAAGKGAKKGDSAKSAPKKGAQKSQAAPKARPAKKGNPEKAAARAKPSAPKAAPAPRRVEPRQIAPRPVEPRPVSPKSAPATSGTSFGKAGTVSTLP